MHLRIQHFTEMARGRKPNAISFNQKPIEQYSHSDKERLNNPPVGLVSNVTDEDYGQKKKKYEYDPHLDPQLQWSGKTERTSFEVPVVSLHVHERIDPKTIIESVRREDNQPRQISLFEQQEKPLREAIEFYKHKENWSNRLIAGDSLLVMNSLLEKEGMADKVQMIYFDPPYGIKYGSNFQPYVNKKDVTDGKDEDLSQEPEMIKAFRDTWELGIHSFLTYMRDRLFLSKELLSDSGSIFVQISDENAHHIRELMDEVFGKENFIAMIAFKTATNQNSKRIQRLYDYLIWYSKSNQLKFRALYRKRTKEEVENIFNNIDPTTGKRYKAGQMGDHYTDRQIANLKKANRITSDGKYLKRFEDDFEYTELDSIWQGTIISTFSKEKVYAVQTSTVTVERCINMVTDPGDLVLDITCGSGTTAYVAEKCGRRWITCDTSRISLSLAKQRLITSYFDYYKLARPEEGIGSGLIYEKASHITTRQIANGEPPDEEALLENPIIDNKKLRITGPFTVESIPAPVVKDLEGILPSENEVDISISRMGETLRQSQWRDELLRAGVRGKGGAMINFSRVEALTGTQYIQAQAETKNSNPEKVLIVFGPEHAPLEQRTVELAINEARYLKPDILLFCAFQFDDEAAKDIDETPEKLIGFKLLKALMNMDLQTDDLKKNSNTNQSFWLIGQPDIELHEIKDGDDKGKLKIEVNGFDYYNPRTGSIESGGKRYIAMWLLDTDYDGRSLFPKQIFFPLAGSGEGWEKLAKNLKSEIDEEKMEAFSGTISLPFTPGKLIAVKIVDDRGIESLKIIKR